jgi:hypothetical protein
MLSPELFAALPGSLGSLNVVILSVTLSIVPCSKYVRLRTQPIFDRVDLVERVGAASRRPPVPSSVATSSMPLTSTTTPHPARSESGADADGRKESSKPTASLSPDSKTTLPTRAESEDFVEVPTYLCPQLLDALRLFWKHATYIYA